MRNIDIFQKAQKACRMIIHYTDSEINKMLIELAKETENSSEFLLAENKRDLDRMDPEDPKYDRLKLTEERIKGVAADIRNVASLASPVGRILESKVLANQLELTKVAVPLGVIGIIYEARPNVTFDVFSLCIKSGNVCLLKGGKDAMYSNMAIMELIYRVLRRHNFSIDTVQLLPVDKSATDELLHANGYVDIIIPRGSQGLIDYVRKNSSVPVIETGAGIVHTYFDSYGDLDKGISIIANAKLRRVSVCNALDCLVIHRDRLKDLPALVMKLAENDCIIYADDPSHNQLVDHYPDSLLFKAAGEHFGTEFLAKKMAIKTVDSLDDALDHIAAYSSKHSEAVITEDQQVKNRFMKEVDAAAVYVNTSTAFTDGAEFGLGAEIGISTQKLHARGPMALHELTSYKWLIEGEGQIRNP